MVQEAEHAGIAKTGTRFVEPTSGNTGIGVSLTAAVRGNYNLNTLEIFSCSLSFAVNFLGVFIFCPIDTESEFVVG